MKFGTKMCHKKYLLTKKNALLGGESNPSPVRQTGILTTIPVHFNTKIKTNLPCIVNYVATLPVML